MSSHVKCNVDNCIYWQDRQCSASDIEVSTKVNKEEACSPDVTFCETFKPKEC